jgi:glycosidase
VNPNYLDGVNAADEEDDPASHLNIYRTLVDLRRTAAVQRGSTVFPDEELADDNTFVFFR